jgi:hypothetical protein
MLVVLAALFFTHPRQRGLRFAPPVRCAGPRVVRTCPPRWDGQNALDSTVASFLATPRARRIGFYHGVGAPTEPPLGAPTLRFARPDAAGGVLCTSGPQPLVLYIRNIIPDDIGIPLLEHLAPSGWGYANFHGVQVWTVFCLGCAGRRVSRPKTFGGGHTTRSVKHRVCRRRWQMR